jgi:hypothetical protein
MKQTQKDFMKHLQTKIKRMKEDCKIFDSGDEDIFLELAVKLRVLLHNTNNQTSVLKHLGKENIDFYNSVYNEYYKDSKEQIRHIGHYNGLANTQYGKKLKWVPLCYTFNNFVPKKIPFDKWWTEQTVMSDLTKVEYKRKDIVLLVSDKDGGAHIDKKLPDDYAKITRENALGWEFERDGKKILQGNPFPACIRQIAGEVLETIKSEFFGTLGRNDKCYCGSGKKYKNCCLNKQDYINKNNGPSITINTIHLKKV